MVAGYFSGGQRSRDTVRYLSGWSRMDGRDGRPLGSRILTCTSTITYIFDNVSKNGKIFVFAYVLIQVWTRSVEAIKEIRESLARRVPWMETPWIETWRGPHTFRQGFPSTIFTIRFLFVCVHALFASRFFSGFSFTRKIMFAIDK